MRYFSPQSVAVIACTMALFGLLGVGQRVQPARASGPVPTPTAVMIVPHPICQGCMVPVPRVVPALYHLVQGRWVPTRNVSLHEPLRFSVLVESGVTGFSHLIVHLRIRRTFIGGHGALGALPNHIYRVGMGSSGLVHGYRRFSGDVHFRSRYMLGVLFASFHISSRTSGIEAGFFFTVHPASTRAGLSAWLMFASSGKIAVASSSAQSPPVGLATSYFQAIATHHYRSAYRMEATCSIALKERPANITVTAVTTLPGRSADPRSGFKLRAIGSRYRRYVISGKASAAIWTSGRACHGNVCVSLSENVGGE